MCKSKKAALAIINKQNPRNRRPTTHCKCNEFQL